VRFSSEFWSFLIHSPELYGSNQQKHLVAKQEKLGEKWPFADDISRSYTAGFF
jgi:hypothetical protein